MNCLSTFADALRMVFHGVCWFIWLERNARIFSDNSTRATLELGFSVIWVYG
ncbi:hypothetical protein LINPERPRIM_LOCUS31667 [Linum perenne]